MGARPRLLGSPYSASASRTQPPTDTPRSATRSACSAVVSAPTWGRAASTSRRASFSLKLSAFSIWNTSASTRAFFGSTFGEP